MNKGFYGFSNPSARTQISLYETNFINDPTLQGYYRFAGNTNDSSGKGKNLSVSGSVNYVEGLFGSGLGKCYGKNVENDFLYIADAMNIDGGPITLGLWFCDIGTSSAANDKGLICQDIATSTKTRYYISRQTTNLTFNRDGVGGGGTSGQVTYTWSLLGKRANHIAMTYDGVRVRGFVNGVEVGSALASGNGNGYSGNVTRFSVGIVEGWDGLPGTTYYPTLGLIGDAFIFSRPLSPGELAYIYDVTKP